MQLHACEFELCLAVGVQDFVTAVHARAGKASGEGKLSSRAEVGPFSHCTP